MCSSGLCATIFIGKTLKTPILLLESKSAQGSLSVSDLCNATSCLNSKDAYDKIITDNAFYLNVREEFEKVGEICFLLLGILFETNLVNYNPVQPGVAFHTKANLLIWRVPAYSLWRCAHNILTLSLRRPLPQFLG